MSESEIRIEILRLLSECGVAEDVSRTITERIMDMVAEHAFERASEAASDAICEYEERM